MAASNHLPNTCQTLANQLGNIDFSLAKSFSERLKERQKKKKEKMFGLFSEEPNIIFFKLAQSILSESIITIAVIVPAVLFFSVPTQKLFTPDKCLASLRTALLENK